MSSLKLYANYMNKTCDLKNSSDHVKWNQRDIDDPETLRDYCCSGRRENVLCYECEKNLERLKKLYVIPEVFVILDILHKETEEMKDMLKNK